MSDTIKNPQAFPQDVLHPVTGKVYGQEPGMTLRDYFAAKALQGHLASEYYAGFNTAEENIKGICANMYTFADQMLKQREL